MSSEPPHVSMLLMGEALEYPRPHELERNARLYTTSVLE